METNSNMVQKMEHSGDGDENSPLTIKPTSDASESKSSYPLPANGHPQQGVQQQPPPPPQSLPIIDISPFLSPSATPSSRLATAQALNSACTTYGFFYLTGHGIPLSTLNSVISLARAFFSLPLAQKNKIKRHNAGGPERGDGARGYQGLGENVTGGLQDMQEAVDWYAEWPNAKREVGPGGEGTVKTLQGWNLWPEEPRDLKGVYEGYVERVKEVGRAVVKCMGVALELGERKEGDGGNGLGGEQEEDEDIFVRACEDSFWVMRMIGYPPLPASSRLSTQEADTANEQDLSQFSCGAHTDYGCITLLLADSTPHALQVLRTDGTWLFADPLPGAFVVNIGDMIERWTNGLWKSTMHRVIHRGTGYRVSVPFFYEPGFDAVVRPLRKCVERTRGMGGKGVVGEGGSVEVGKGKVDGRFTGEREGKGRDEGSGTYGEHLLTKVFSNFYYSKRTDW